MKEIDKIGKERVRVFKSILKNLQPGLSLVDLGAGHGMFSKAAYDLGFNVTAVDARDERFPSEYITEYSIKFIKEDIRNVKVYDYDVICILGVLYHLDDPIKLLQKCSHTFTILDTHFAMGEEVEHLGYKGRYYNEGNELTSSFGNKQSFWPTKPELIRMIKDSGYGTVFEMVPNYMHDRSFFICYPK